MEDNFIFWHEKVLNPDSFSNLFYKQEMSKSILQVLSVRKQKQNMKFIIHSWSDKAFKGTVVYRA